MTTDTESLLSAVQNAVAEDKLSAGAVENIRSWLTDSRYADYASQVAEHIGVAENLLQLPYSRVQQHGLEKLLKPLTLLRVNDLFCGKCF